MLTSLVNLALFDRPGGAMKRLKKNPPSTCKWGWVVFFGLGGCTAHTAVDPHLVVGQWQKTIEYLNIYAVYPPRLVNVGDVFLVPVSRDPQAAVAEVSGPVNNSVRLTSVDVRGIVKKDWQKHLNLPATPLNSTGTAINLPASSTGAADVFKTRSTFTTLPVAAFPGLNVVHISQGDLGAAFPINVFKTVIAAAFSDQMALSISIPSAFSVELPMADAYTRFVRFCESRATRTMCSPNSKLVDNVAATMNGYDPATDDLDILFVTTVYYAQQIQYSFSHDSASAFSAAVSPLATLDNQAAAGASVSDTSGASAAAGGAAVNVSVAPSADPAAAAAANLQAVNDRIAAINQRLSGMTAGGTVTVASADSQGTVLNQIFPYPVAIGYSAIKFRIK
jgi:hypothetical protein